MMCNSCSEHNKNSIDNVFKGINIAKNEETLFIQFLNNHDFSVHTIKAFRQDIRKFATYFVSNNHEPFSSARITVMDLTGFKKYLREEKTQAVATVNRALVCIRRYLDWLVSQEHLKVNPAKMVKELKRQQLVPQGLERNQVRKLLREIELRNDIRSRAIFTTFLHTGCRVSDLVNVELQDLIINERSGYIVFRLGKGGKQRQVPLSLSSRRAIQEYLRVRPPVSSDILFIGERGALSDIGIRSLCKKYSAICGFKIYPHLLRHSMAHQFLKDNSNDLVSLAQILGHENLNTTARYTQRTSEQLAEAAERLSY